LYHNKARRTIEKRVFWQSQGKALRALPQTLAWGAPLDPIRKNLVVMGLCTSLSSAMSKNILEFKFKAIAF
jgi:hypothetical protein